MSLYHPRPERWPQVSLKGLLVLVTVSALIVQAIEIGREHAKARRNACRSIMHRIDIVPSQSGR
jgi:hypothetical protein